MLNCRIIKLNGYKIISKKIQYYKKCFYFFPLNKSEVVVIRSYLMWFMHKYSDHKYQNLFIMKFHKLLMHFK